MEQTGTVKLAKMLKVLLNITFVCNLAVLPLVPGMVSYSVDGGLEAFARFWAYEWDDALWDFFFHQRWWETEYTFALTLFLLFCGICTAITLWQARGMVGTIVRQDTFTIPNAKRMRVAAVCFLFISTAALGRTIWGFMYYKSILPLFTYTALFVPIFLMAGLLCMVMSTLFRQAAELKEENDLTI